MTQRDDLVSRLERQSSGPDGYVTVFNGLLKDAATALEAKDAEIARLRQDCGDFLAAAGFRRDADLKNQLTRKVILDDVAGMRPEMVKARRKQQRVEGDALLWQCFAAEGQFQPLLLTVWKQRRAAESRIAELERQLAEKNGGRDAE